MRWEKGNAMGKEGGEGKKVEKSRERRENAAQGKKKRKKHHYKPFYHADSRATLGFAFSFLPTLEMHGVFCIFIFFLTYRRESVRKLFCVGAQGSVCKLDPVQLNILRGPVLT